MNSSKSIGGYPELELKRGAVFHKDAIAVNSAHNGLGLILQSRRPTKVYIPKYVCDVLLEPLKRLEIEHQFYSINEKLEINNELNLSDDELLVYVNYFGIKNSYTRELSGLLKNKLVIDCSQSFYFSVANDSHAIYSPRKFFGVADGGYVATSDIINSDLAIDTSYQRMEHLLRRIDNGAEDGYEAFKLNDASLVDQPIMQMSNLTRRILETVDYELVREKRLANFSILHDSLRTSNQLNLDIKSIDGPMAYPLLMKHGRHLRKKLKEKKIYVPTYWPNVFDWCQKEEYEYFLADNLLAIPIDQRYDENDMKLIVEAINES